MTTTTTTTPSTGLHLPTDARPIAILATTQSTATREMSGDASRTLAEAELDTSGG